MMDVLILFVFPEGSISSTASSTRLLRRRGISVPVAEGAPRHESCESAEESAEASLPRLVPDAGRLCGRVTPRICERARVYDGR